jgi:Flp pilus assembly protein TadG
MSKFKLAAVWSNNRGTTAVEFAIIAPVFLGLVVSIFHLCMGLWLVGSQHFAVEDAARCASVETLATQPCKNASGVISYAKSHYYGPRSPTPTFTYNPAAACGKSVSATVNYAMNLMLKEVTIPISATACFP